MSKNKLITNYFLKGEKLINRIKNWNYKNFNIKDRSLMNFTFIVAVMALIISIPGGSNCASANTCSVASTANFTGDVSLKSNTNYSATLQHSLAANVIANIIDPGYAHTGSLILKDSSGDFNLDGGLRLGTSATSTAGFLRWNGTAVQYVNSGGVWGDIDTTATPSNSFGTIDTTTGSVAAGSTGATVTFVGAGGLTTSATGSTVTITAPAASGSSTEFASYKLSGDQSVTEGSATYTTIDWDTETYDSENCFTISAGTLTYTCSDSVYYKWDMVYRSIGGNNIQQGDFQKNNSTYQGYGMWTSTSGSASSQLLISSNSIVCLDQNDTQRVQMYTSAYTGNYNVQEAASRWNFIKLAVKGSSC